MLSHNCKIVEVLRAVRWASNGFIQQGKCNSTWTQCDSDKASTGIVNVSYTLTHPQFLKFTDMLSKEASDYVKSDQFKTHVNVSNLWTHSIHDSKSIH